MESPRLARVATALIFLARFAFACPLGERMRKYHQICYVALPAPGGQCHIWAQQNGRHHPFVDRIQRLRSLYQTAARREQEQLMRDDHDDGDPDNDDRHDFKRTACGPDACEGGQGGDADACA